MRTTFRGLCLLTLVIASLGAPAGLWAAFGEDSTVPVPEFSRQEAAIVATLIPQGKSTRITIRFDARDGRLEEVQAMDFAEGRQPGVHLRDFRSALFRVTVGGVPPGGVAGVALRSRYFTSSTRFWVFNPGRAPAWADGEAQNIAHPERINELLVRVQDGGPLDSDGAADGAILLVGGPRDSFWGYALGTLFIRFFGIFLVLGVLMLGMMSSSRIFQFLEGRAARMASPEPLPQAPPHHAASGPGALTPEKIAAIAAAWHFHTRPGRSQPPPAGASDTPSSSWSAQGRSLVMGGRQSVYRRPPRT